MHTKIREDNEARYVSEYVLEKFPRCSQKIRCPLGGAPEMWIKEMGFSKALRTYRPYRPEVDAVVIDKDKIILIEGKILKVMDGISKLPVYRFLVRETPELDIYRTKKIEARLVTPHPPGWCERVAKEFDVTIDLFEPDWIKDYRQKQEKYWTTEERVERHKRRETLKGLGMK